MPTSQPACSSGCSRAFPALLRRGLSWAGSCRANNKHLSAATNKRQRAQEPWQSCWAACVQWDNKSTPKCLHVERGLLSWRAAGLRQEQGCWGGRAGLWQPQAQGHPSSGPELNHPLLPQSSPTAPGKCPCSQEILWDTSVHEPRLSHSTGICWLHFFKQFPFFLPFPRSVSVCPAPFVHARTAGISEHFCLVGDTESFVFPREWVLRST